ncbi:MAG: phosphotransferase family protein [Actinobacteria bacterium]|nr:MAG: phosphotransferase family protein [Actinomycetota bacterium]
MTWGPRWSTRSASSPRSTGAPRVSTGSAVPTGTWTARSEQARTRDLPAVDVVSEWLRAHTPSMGDAAILHGDYQFANVMFRPDLPARVTAVIDWEQSTIGDPLVDIGWMLALWDEPGEDPVRGAGETRVNQQPGFPSRAELAASYAARTGFSLEHLGWYEVLALFKLACVLEGAYARASTRGTDPC